MEVSLLGFKHNGQIRFFTEESSKLLEKLNVTSVKSLIRTAFRKNLISL
jgi:hypothetical protein